jgi:hypothetical protein
MGKQGFLILAIVSFLALNFTTIIFPQTEHYIGDEPAINISTKPLANVIWHWEDSFAESETHQIKNWLATVNKAVIQTLGNYPFKTHFYIHRSTRGDEPVPWANTTRGKKQGVHFHINMDYPLNEFLNDWTAQHEISHLSIPFVGSENSWFSEGYATFMQYQIMKAQGVFTESEIQEKYLNRVADCKSSYQTNLTFPEAADSLKGVWNYPDMYWGGVSFFWTLNQEYQKQNRSLNDVVKAYVNCCRVNESTPKELCEAFDKITQSEIATKLLDQYETQPAYLIFEKM